MIRQRTAAGSSIALVVAVALAAATPAIVDAQTTCTPHITNWTSFDIPGIPQPNPGAQPLAINDYGEVTGNYRSSSQSSMQGLAFSRYPNGTIVDITVPDSGGRTYVSGINNQGQIIGEYIGGSDSVVPNQGRGFIRWAHGALTIIDGPVPSPAYTGVTGINNWAVSVGTFPMDYNGKTSEGFLRHADGSITTIGANTALLYINDQGVALGGTSAGFLLLKPDGTRVIWNPPLGTKYAQLVGLDIEGSVVFNASYAGLDDVGFIRHPSGTFLPIWPSTPTYNSLKLRSINNLGTVVGYEYNTSSGAQAGFAQIWYGPRVLVNAPVAGQRGTTPTAINNHNVMTGYWEDSNYMGHGFVATLVTCN